MQQNIVTPSPRNFVYKGDKRRDIAQIKMGHCTQHLIFLLILVIIATSASLAREDQTGLQNAEENPAGDPLDEDVHVLFNSEQDLDLRHEIG